LSAVDAEVLLTLPGGEIVAKGIADLARGEETDEALLVSMSSRRLRELGLPIVEPLESPRDRLYDRLSAREGDAAHARFNALVRRLVRFQRAAACVSG
jgi:hypothetical protein